MAVQGTPEALKKPGFGQVLNDTRYVFWREMLLPLRDPFSLIFSLLQPLVFLGLFGPLLGSAVGAPAFGGQSTLQWFLPGVVVMIALFGTSMTGSNLQYELMTGSYERILATPLSRSSLMIGRALKEWAPQQTLLLPLMILSGIMLPIEAGPDWMKAASWFNPLTYLVNAERELFAGNVGTDTLLGLLAAVVSAAVGLVVGVRTISRNTN